MLLNAHYLDILYVICIIHWFVCKLLIGTEVLFTEQIKMPNTAQSGVVNSILDTYN